MKRNNQRSIVEDEADMDQIEIKPHWKIYLGVAWGIVSVGLFLMNHLLGIISPLLYVIYLFMDAKFDCYCKRLIQRFKKEKLKKSNAA